MEKQDEQRDTTDGAKLLWRNQNTILESVTKKKCIHEEYITTIK